MAFTHKDWKDEPDHTTAISAAALKDLEDRLAAYTDTETATALAAAVASSLQASSNLADVPNKATARTNLGLQGGGVGPWLPGFLYIAGSVVLQNGLLWSRNTDGTSAGSWVSDAANWTALTAAGTELAYAEITANATPGSSAADVAGLTITFTAPARPVLLRAWCYGITVSTSWEVALFQIVDASNVVVCLGTGGQPITASPSISVARRLSGLTPGTSYTYKVQAAVFTHGGTLAAGATYPAHIQATQL